MKWLFYRFLYRPLMRLAHKHHWHYAPPLYPEGDMMLRCDWCGFRQVIRKSTRSISTYCPQEVTATNTPDAAQEKPGG